MVQAEFIHINSLNRNSAFNVAIQRIGKVPDSLFTWLEETVSHSEESELLGLPQYNVEKGFKGLGSGMLKSGFVISDLLTCPGRLQKTYLSTEL